MSSMSDTITVVGAIFSRGEEILACRRAPHKAAAGKWEFPGGKVEDGEQPQAALARELHEELGISAEVGDLLVRETTPPRARPSALPVTGLPPPRF